MHMEERVCARQIAKQMTHLLSIKFSDQPNTTYIWLSIPPSPINGVKRIQCIFTHRWDFYFWTIQFRIFLNVWLPCEMLSWKFRGQRMTGTYICSVNLIKFAWEIMKLLMKMRVVLLVLNRVYNTSQINKRPEGLDW